MTTHHRTSILVLAALCAPLTLAACALDPGPEGDVETRGQKPPKFRTGTENLHLEETVRFNNANPAADLARGQAVFGLADDGVSEDPSEALFSGVSFVYGGPVPSNGRTCFTCHRGPDQQFGLPTPPLSDTIPLTDTLFTGIDADAGGDPDALHNLDQLGLVKYRVNRFNPTRGDDDPYRQVFGWRKSIPLVNVGFAHGFLTDGRGRVMFETARGAFFAHTQESDNRFDDLIAARRSDFDDMEAFLFGLVSDPALLALKDPNDPNYEALVDDPYLTVDMMVGDPSKELQKARKRGKKLFDKNCFGACHNTPQLFNNLANVEATGNGDRPQDYVPHAPAVGRMFNVGVAERNAHGLRFTRHLGGGAFAPIVVPLANEDGSTHHHEVTFDIGLAASTGRTEDIGRFKVPQLRDLANNAPYFHDNSAATLEEVVEYFSSCEYNDSKDGQEYPIHLSPSEQADLVEFLKIL
ncbi:MAG: hypothetical protein R3B09_15045 [Nannocystaceae bacterium]